MIKLRIFLACFFFINSVYAQKPDALIDVLHYSFSITVSDNNDEVEGRARIRFVALKETNSIAINFVKTGSDKKGMSVTSVLEENQPISFTHNNDLLKITFGRKLPPRTMRSLPFL